MKSLLEKVLDRLRSSRVWATVAGNIMGIEMVEDGWPRAVVVLGVNLAYIASETYLKRYPPPP